MQRLIEVAQRHGRDRDFAIVGVPRGIDAVAQAGGTGRAHGEEPADRHMRRQLRRRGVFFAVGDETLPGHLPRICAALAVGSRRQARSRAAARPSALPAIPGRRRADRTGGSSAAGVRRTAHQIRECGHGRLDLLVGPILQEGALLQIGDCRQRNHPRHREPEHGREHAHVQGGHREAAPAPQGAYPLGGCRPYPTPRTVRIIPGPCASSFLRR